MTGVVQPLGVARRTELFYYSDIYEWPVELPDVDRSTHPYRFQELPMERSADGWVRVVDGNVRKSLRVYTLATPKPGASALDVGGL